MLIYSFSSLVSQAIKILEDEVQCDIIKIGNLVRNKVQFNLSLGGSIITHSCACILVPFHVGLCKDNQ